MNKILLNNQVYKPKEEDLPYLIIYGDKSGGSHFTVTLITELFLSGSKILFFTAFPMAKDNFLEQVGPSHSTIAFVNSSEDLANHKDAPVIILDSGNEKLFIETTKTLKDLKERVVLVKNIEAFSEDAFNSCLHLEKIVLSGNIDTCIRKEDILKKSFQTIVVFTKPEIALPFEVPTLEKWTGYLSSDGATGMIKVEMD